VTEWGAVRNGLRINVNLVGHSPVIREDDSTEGLKGQIEAGRFIEGSYNSLWRLVSSSHNQCEGRDDLGQGVASQVMDTHHVAAETVS